MDLKAPISNFPERNGIVFKSMKANGRFIYAPMIGLCAIWECFLTCTNTNNKCYYVWLFIFIIRHKQHIFYGTHSQCNWYILLTHHRYNSCMIQSFERWLLIWETPMHLTYHTHTHAHTHTHICVCVFISCNRLLSPAKCKSITSNNWNTIYKQCVIQGSPDIASLKS